MAVDKIPIWNKAVLTSEEAAEYGNLALAVIQAHARLAKEGRSSFPCFWSGENIRVHRQSFDKWLEELALGHHVIELKMVNEVIKKLNNGELSKKARRGRPRKIREKII